MASDLVHNRSFNATTSLATRQFRFVKADTSGGISLCGVGDYAVGVLQDKPGAGDPGAVCTPGDITKIVLGATLTAGQYVMSDSTGRAVAAVSGAYALGQVREGGAADEIGVIVFQPVVAHM